MQKKPFGVIITVCILACLPTAGCRRAHKQALEQPSTNTELPAIEPWKRAVLKVEEDRNAPAGHQAVVEIPAELRHASDRRRFLSMQVAEWRKQHYQIPHDFAELAEMIRQGQFVEVKPLGESYLLYGVGANITDGPLTHYDRASGQSIPLFSNDAEFEKADDLLAASIKELQSKIRELKNELLRIPKHDRAGRRLLLAQIRECRSSLGSTAERKEALEHFHKNAKLRSLISSEYETLRQLAADFDGHSYDLADPQSRREFKSRLLSFIRPEARHLLEQIASTYKREFDRHLPITSLVRTQEYQNKLSEVNPNAARNRVPPHATGLAFDIYYHYMTAEEQNLLMAEIARLKNEGRVEALRENRDNIHVFAFAGGQPPNLLINEAARTTGVTHRRAQTGGRRKWLRSE
jgi:hypothetical protein